MAKRKQPVKPAEALVARARRRKRAGLAAVHKAAVKVALAPTAAAKFFGVA